MATSDRSAEGTGRLETRAHGSSIHHSGWVVDWSGAAVGSGNRISGRSRAGIAVEAFRAVDTS